MQEGPFNIGVRSLRFRIILDAMKTPSGQSTVIVDAPALFQNLEYYEKQGIKWIVVKA